MGLIMSIIAGGLAGWAASNVMNTGTGLLINVILGIIGAVVASFVLGFLGVHFSGFLGNIISGFIGAVGLVYGYRALQKR